MVCWIVLALLVVHLGGLAATALAYEIVAVEDGGTVTGRVVFVGPIPSLPDLMISKDQEVCGTTTPAQMLLVSEANRGVKNTVIALEGIDRGKAPTAQQPMLDNRMCVMEPRVQAVMVGTMLVVQNSDPFLHTTRGRLPNRKQAFNLVFPRDAPAREQRIRFPGVIAVHCDTHTHMQAYILSFTHPYFAVTDADGRFAIDQVPPGSYTLTAWHEGWRTLTHDQEGRPTYEEPYVMTTEVTVTAGQTSTVELQLASRE